MKATSLICLAALVAVGAVSASGDPTIIDLASADRQRIMEFQGQSAGDKMGLAIAVADFDGDGFDDLLMGAPFADNSTGKVFIYFGSADHGGKDIYDIATYTGGDIIQIKPSEKNGFFGYWCGGGDFNGDGYGDFAIGASKESPLGRYGAGKVTIIFGERNARDRKNTTIGDDSFFHCSIYGTAVNGEHGFRIGSGDFNGDGIDDLISGSIHAGGNESRAPGQAYIVFGSTTLSSRGSIDLAVRDEGFLTIEAFDYGLDYPDNLGYSVSSGDINGDGFDDAMISARFADPYNVPNTGEVYIIFGRADIADTRLISLAAKPQGTMRISGEYEHAYTGDDINAGDIDGDGFDDVVINAYAADPLGRANAGITYVLKGSQTFAARGDIRLQNPGIPFVRIYGEASEDHMEPLWTGDINGDGFKDIISGALNHDPFERSSAGTGYIINGSADFFSKQIIDLLKKPDGVTYLRGATAGDRMARTCAGDFNGDGVEDAVIAAVEGDAHGRRDTGKVFVYWGSGGNPAASQQFAFVPNTGNNATVLIPMANPPVINGSLIAAGDIIGVFTTDGRCAGSAKWKGVNLPITIWGDDPYTSGVNGFADGEELIFKVLDVSKGIVSTLSPEYEQGDGYYRPDSIYILSSLASRKITQTIALDTGWNCISLALTPQSKKMSDILAPILPSVVFMKNAAGNVFWPEYNIDTIGEWDISQGYHIYLNDPAQLSLEGYEIPQGGMQYRLAGGWNLIGYSGVDNMAPADAFAAISGKLVLVKNAYGDIYWPEYSIATLQSMQRGEGYWVYLTAPAVFAYPVSGASARIASRADYHTTHFVPVSRTGGNAVLCLPNAVLKAASGGLLTTGDELQIVGKSGVCAGAGVWHDGENLAITVWGDDAMTDEIDGLSAGEAYRFVAWDRESGREFECKVTLDSGNTVYNLNDIIVLGGIGETGVGVADASPAAFSLAQNTPNPFNPSTTIRFSLGGESRVTLDIFAVNGAKVATLAEGTMSAGEHEVVWDASGFPSGVYFCRLKAGANERTIKMILVK